MKERITPAFLLKQGLLSWLTIQLALAISTALSSLSVNLIRFFTDDAFIQTILCTILDLVLGSALLFLLFLKRQRDEWQDQHRYFLPLLVAFPLHFAVSFLPIPLFAGIGITSLAEGIATGFDPREELLVAPAKVYIPLLLGACALRLLTISMAYLVTRKKEK